MVQVRQDRAKQAEAQRPDGGGEKDFGLGEGIVFFEKQGELRQQQEDHGGQGTVTHFKGLVDHAMRVVIKGAED